MSSPLPRTASAPPVTRRPAPGKRLVKALIKLALLGAMTYFWIVLVRKSLAELDGLDWKIDPAAALQACGLFFLASVLFGVLWAPLCAEITGIRLGLLFAFRVSMIGWIARYLPGKVWSTAGKAYYSCRDKAQFAPVTIAITVETIWFEASGLLLAAIILPWYPDLPIMTARTRWLSVLFLAASLLFAWPPLFCRISNAGLRLLRQPPLPRRPRYFMLLALMAGYMAVFALFSAGFLVLARSYAPVPADAFPLLIGAFTASWVIGFLTFLAPNGLGVRDTLLAAILTKAAVMPAVAVMPLVLVCRVLTMVIEVVCALIALALPLLGLGRTAARE